MECWLFILNCVCACFAECFAYNPHCCSPLFWWREWTANSNSTTIQQQQQQTRRVLSNLANTNNLNNNNEDACRVPNSTVNSLASTVGSATASIHNNNSSHTLSAVVPNSNGSYNISITSSNIIKLKQFSSTFIHSLFMIIKIVSLILR